MPPTMIATFLGLTVLLSAPADAASPHAAQVPVPRERPSSIPAPSPAVKVPGMKSGLHGNATGQASIHAKRATQSVARVIVIKPPAPAKVASTGAGQRLATERTQNELTPGIVSPSYSVSAVPQTPVPGAPVWPSPIQQVPVVQPRYFATPVKPQLVFQARINQTSINSDLMTQPMVGHTRI